MRRLIYLALLVFILLAACNVNEQEEHDTSTLYTHERELKQNFEGVTLTMTYVVRQEGDALGLEITGTVYNGFTKKVYYTPDFAVETAEGDRFEGEEMVEIALEPEQEQTFIQRIELTQLAYEDNEFINLFVPATFKEPGSESSGDALGDTVWWELPIK